MYGSLDISVSGMMAQRTRLAVIANNLANAETMLNAAGEYEPYQRREVMFSAGNPSAANPGMRGMGVHVASIRANPDALRSKFDPDSPFADEKGYVKVPDISPIVEQVNALDAARAYEANLAAADTTRTMMAQALRLLA